jgi:basic membrane protein A
MISYDNPKNLIKNYMSDIETSSQDGAYLAGVLAAKKTKTNKLGIVISAADTNWFKQSGGFVAGARSVNPDVKFSFAQVGQAAYDDAAGGKRVMQATIASGADVVFGMGDGATLGYIQAVETSSKKVWFIDVIGNPTPIDKKGAILSSVLWDFSKVFKQAIADINKGTYGTHFYTLGLNNGVSLMQTKYIPGPVWKLIQQTRKGIISGSIKVPLTPDVKSVKALMK